jgi:transposase
MASIIKKKKKNQYYYYIVESQRVNGKPRIVWQKYLGKAEDIAKAMDEPEQLATPKHARIFNFGAVAALYDIAQKLKLVETIDSHVAKREQGASVGEYMLIAAINRALAPTSKSKIGDWFDDTVLSRLLPVNKQQLSSQRFWDNMNLLSEDVIQSIESEIVTRLVREFNISLDCLVYDTTNFFTYMDTMNASKLPQRGYSKEKRYDLKIIGLALMVSTDFHVPLFHQAYAGNIPDAKQFGQVIEKLTQRCREITQNVENITLVFDKGNNSIDNIEDLTNKCFHYVGSLTPSHHKDLLAVPQTEYQPVNQDKYPGVTAYRTTKNIFGREMAVVVTHNPKLLQGQMQGIMLQIEKCVHQLTELQSKLLQRQGKPRKGRAITRASVEKQVKKILSAQYVSEIFDIHIDDAQVDEPQFSFKVNPAKLEQVQEMYLGKNILFTNNLDWDTEKIIAAYRNQYKIEESFKRMKDIHFLSYRPVFHWTDQKIRVHTFYCVVALMLCSLLKRELYLKGIKMSIPQILDTLSNIKEVVVVYPKKGQSKKDRLQVTFSKLTPEQKKLLEVLCLKKYSLVG